MINRISIDNFATIEHLTFDLGDNLNVITGETGAGKSVLVEAISTVLGGRADISMVRNGTDKAVIQLSGDKDGQEVIITRELLSSGKSHAKLNGNMVTLQELRDFTSDMVDIHGQYDNQLILNPDNHIIITDRFHHEAIKHELETLASRYSAYKEASKEYNRLLDEEKQARQQKDFYQFEFDYISKLSLIPHEDEELRDQLDLMKNSERIYQAINTSYVGIHEAEGSALSVLNRCMNEIASVASYSESLTHMSEDLQDIYYRLEDISGNLRDMTSSLSFSNEELDEVQQRLSDIEDAKRKYGMTVEEIIVYMNELDDKLSLIQNFDAEKSRLKSQLDARYEELSEAADRVSEKRHIIAERLESMMVNELHDLDFANSDFKIDITRADEIGPTGYDVVQFLISTNPGEPLMPLAKIASGGEISRVMLAFKHIIGDSDMVDTMIFDEIDTGISGRTALTVGKKLREIAEHHQIVCITHLAQIASYGQDNYLITKSIAEGTSHTSIDHLDADGKVKMVATLFSGSQDDSAIEAARELIDKTAN